MIPPAWFTRNLELARTIAAVPGCVIECGVWRGGMIAAVAELLGPTRHYLLFDSFEGLPPARDIDGERAKQWQANCDGPMYFNNCKAEETYARRAMELAGAKRVTTIRGWFAATVTAFTPSEPIALLRLDGDWYDSTIICLEAFVPHMADNGIIIIDDYYTWDGCRRAVHDYLAKIKSGLAIQEHGGVAYIRSVGRALGDVHFSVAAASAGSM